MKNDKIDISQIFNLFVSGLNISEIAEKMGKHRNTIGKEIKSKQFQELENQYIATLKFDVIKTQRKISKVVNDTILDFYKINDFDIAEERKIILKLRVLTCLSKYSTIRILN